MVWLTSIPVRLVNAARTKGSFRPDQPITSAGGHDPHTNQIKHIEAPEACASGASMFHDNYPDILSVVIVPKPILRLRSKCAFGNFLSLLLDSVYSS